MKKALGVLFFTLVLGQIYAQSLRIIGQVIDKASGLALPGATIIEKGTSNGTISAEDGSFTLDLLKEEAQLFVSFIGYAQLELAAISGDSLEIQLFPKAAYIDEVVVTALNLKRESKDLGYVVQKLNSMEISEVKSPNFIDNLAGQVAGFSVSQGASGVGSSSKITIRGESSFTNNNPLFVVDGIPINNNTNLNNTTDAAAGFQEVDFGNGGMEISQDDIESISVLKGPGAAALYGTRAANGVVIISTKDGSGSIGLRVNFNSTFFIDEAFKLPRLQNQFGQGNSGKFTFVDGLGAGVNDNISYSWGPRLNQGILIPQFDSPVTLADGTVIRGGDVAVHGGRSITPTPFVSYPNNLRDFYLTGTTSMNNLALSSSFEGGHYRFSFADLRSESFIPGVNLGRQNISTRLSFEPLEKLHISTSINYIKSNSENRPSSGYGSENINYSLVAWGPRSLNIEALKDYWQPGLDGLQQYSFNYTFFDNPYFILKENRNGFDRDRWFGNINASYSIADHLSLSMSSGVDRSTELRTYRRNFSTNRFKSGAYAEQSVDFKEYNTNFLLSYQKSFGHFELDYSVGSNRMDQMKSSIQTEALSLAQAGIFSFSNASSPIRVLDIESHKRINSVYSFVKLSFKDLIYLELTGRNDWSSSLANPLSSNNSSFFYPSISGAYLLSNHFGLPDAISFAKLRVSWAQVGNDTDPYQTSGAFISRTPFNSLPTFSSQDVVPNANLLPEKTNAIELGADFRFFDDRLRFDFSYYNSLTENQIISFPTALSSGYTQRIVNGGAVRSKGIEFIVGITPVVKKDIYWNIVLNYSQNESRVESLPDGADKITLAYSRVYDNVNQTVWFQVEEGGQIGDMYGTGYLKNENGDFIINSSGNYIVNNVLKKLGNYNPDFMLGFRNEFHYKRWNLSMLLDWRQGGKLVSRTLSLAGVGGQLIETENRPESGIVASGVVNTGSPDNPVWATNQIPITAESYYRQYYDRNHEENNLYDASYLKLRQVSIGYSFESSAESGIIKRGSTLRVSVIGRNLFAWSDIPHFDPEQLAVQGNKFVSGVEDMSYPSSRSIGIKLGYSF